MALYCCINGVSELFFSLVFDTNKNTFACKRKYNHQQVTQKPRLYELLIVMNRKLSNDELGRIAPADFKTTDKLNVVVVLDDVRSLNNVGSIFRTADAFLIKKIYLCGITGKPPHKDIQKTALGATETVDWEHIQDINSCIDQLTEEGYDIIAIEQAEQTTMLENIKFETTKRYALVLGNEVKGVNQDVVSKANIVLEIPQKGTKHSLNVSVSGGIVLWEAFRQLY